MVKNILIVDNDKNFSTILCEGLNNHAAFNAVLVHTSTRALEYVVEQPVDLVIVDMGLNDMAAPKLVGAIREVKNGLPVMVTPVIGQDIPESVKRLDIQGVIPKPFFVGDLPKIVGTVLGLDLDSQIPDLPATKPDKPARRTPRQTRAESRRAASARTPSEPSSSSAKTGQRATSPSASTKTPVPTETTFLSTLPSWKLERLRKSRDKIITQLEEMNRDFRAEVLLLTAGSELIAKAGTMDDERAQELAILVTKGAEAVAQTAAFLGERDDRFEQSLHEGNEYRLYAYSLGEGVVLSLAVSITVPLGILRHQTKRLCQKLMQEYIQ